MTPSWYDVLDVEPTASTQQIRAAWKAAIGDLEPGSRRFRALNDAAEVLLDPARRAEHDAALSRDAAASPTDEPVPAAASGPGSSAPVPPTHEEPRTRSTRWPPPAWLLVGMLVLVGVLVGLCAWQLSVPSDASVRASTRTAQASAERAAVAVLSYDYEDLDASESSAASYLTPDYRRTDYDPLFEVIKENAPATRTKVTAEVVASGIVRSGDDRVSVLVFVNRPTTNASTTQPLVYRDQVTMQMTRTGDEWLVDGMVTTPAEQ